MRIKIPKLVKALYPRRTWNGPKGEQTVYLTFDDGPVPEITPWVLEQLEHYGAKATFFCIGENIAKYPEIFLRVLAGGHAVGNHTYNHLNGWKTPEESYVKNTQKAQKTLEKNGFSVPSRPHPQPLLFRPPYGKLKGRQARVLMEKGYKIIMWDVLSRDYSAAITPERCYQNVIQNVTDGSIIVFHDSIKAAPNLRHALPKVLHELDQQGFQLASL